jgi:hypothetical protein
MNNMSIYLKMLSVLRNFKVAASYRIVQCGFAIVCGLLIIFVISNNLDQESRIEFSPDSFSSRSMTHYYLHCTRIVLFSTERDHYKEPLVELWISLGLLNKRTEKNVIWDIVRSNCPAVRSDSVGPAGRFWARSGFSQEEWIVWTNANKQMAVILWAEIVNLLSAASKESNKNYYELAGDLLREVINCRDENQLTRRIIRWKKMYRIH